MPTGIPYTAFSRVSIGSDQTYITDSRLQIQSDATLEVDGFTDHSSGQFLSRQTSASVTSDFLADGELSITSVSASSCVVSFRSGNTTYHFIADNATL